MVLRRMSRLAFVCCVLLGAILGLGAYTFRYAEGTAYLSNDPRACVNCHVMRDHYDDWQKASHHSAATCNDCHVPHDLIGKYLSKAKNGFWHSYGFTMQNFHEPIRIKPGNAEVLQANCIDCHAGVVREMVDRGSAADASNNCLRCHNAVGHGPIR